jgi:flavin reductase (DIM6/NTAB) family NADH-FMN oxidoreductase RutF
MKVDPSLIHRLFYPQVPLVMAAEYRGRVSAMPVVSYLSVSDRPPMVGVACMPGGFTCRLAQKAGCFSLSALGKERAAAISTLATVSGSKVRDKLAEAGLRYHAGTKVKAPVPRDAVAALECSLDSKKATGDHVLLFGRVEAAYANRAFGDFWDFRKYEPILYAGWKEGLTLYREGQA